MIETTRHTAPDALLIDAIRCDPPDAVALDALVRRHWAGLSARCWRIARDRDAVHDLMQETWCRVLGARHRLDSMGNFAGYLAMTATNLWRDWNRPARRGSAMAVCRHQTLQGGGTQTEGDAPAFADVVADPKTLDREERVSSSIDLARGLAGLTPHVREVIVARFHHGETAAQIGRRYGRTQQTITSWLRQGIRELRQAVK